MAPSWVTSYFKLNNPLFLDVLVASVLYVIYRVLLKFKWTRLAECIKEASLIFMIFMFYDCSRYFALAELEDAVENAYKVIRFEEMVGLNGERFFQELILPYKSFTKFLGTFYLAAHWGGIVLFFVWAITRIGNDDRKRSEFRKARGRFIFMNLVACISFITFPCAPPRIIPGYIDTLAAVSKVDVYSSTRRFVNPYAAMPSMHQGYSLLFTISTVTMLYASINAGLSKKRAGTFECLESGLSLDADPKQRGFRYLSLLPFVGLLYPCFMFFTIVSTANHFILDAIVGAMAFGIGCLLYELACRLHAKVQEKYFHKKTVPGEKLPYVSISVSSIEMDRRDGVQDN